MIYLIMKSYLIIFLFVIAGAITLFFSGLYWIFKPKKKVATQPAKNTGNSTKKTKKKTTTISSSDIHAIAGDDVMATQLDLARAYIETGKVQLAKKILDHVVEKGSNVQQQEARYLLGFI